MNNRFFLVSVLVFSTTLLLSCDGEGNSSRSTNKTALTDTISKSDLLPNYEVVAVKNGGIIQGQVLLEGPAPRLANFEITTNPDICAGAADNNRLQVGENGGIAWGVVRLIGVRKGKVLSQLSEQDLAVNQVGCRYTPHVIAAPVGGQVYFQNSDQTPHNVRVENVEEDILMNVAQPRRGDLDTFVVKTIGPMSVGCDYHPWMNAYVFGVDNPYYAVTGPDGSFQITDIPPGEYQLRLWLNGFQPKPKRDNRGNIIRYQFSSPQETGRTVIVKAGETTEEHFRINAKG